MAKIRKRLLPSGEVRWLADYVDSAGKRRAKQFEKRKDADDYLVKVRRDLQLGQHVADSASITVKAAADLWLARGDDVGLERSTRARNRQHVELHVVPFIGTRKLSQMTTPAVHAFADELAREGRSGAMVKGVMVSLGAIFKEARRRGLAMTNPVSDAGIKVHGDRRKSTRPTIPTGEELKAVLEHATGKHRALIVVALFSGLRASELRGLRWRNVDLKRGIVSVRERVDQWGSFGPPKSTAGTRDVPLPAYAVAALKEHRLAAPGTDGGLVFASLAGTPLTHQNMIKRIWNPLQFKTGLVTDTGRRDEEGRPVLAAKYGFHVLRHAAASLFIEQRLSPKRISALMGHSSIQVTFDVYGHLLHDDDADQAALAAIEARLLS